MSSSSVDLPKAGLSVDWFELEGLSERGAGGRLVVAPGVLTRADLDFNWNIVAVAMQHMGARPGVDQLQDEVDLFFQRCRQKGKKPVSRYQPRSHESLDEQHGSEEVGYDEAVESEAATDDEICEPEKPREPQGSIPSVPSTAPVITPKHAAGDVTTQETQVMDDSSMEAAVGVILKDVDAKEKAAVAAHVFDSRTPPKLGPKRLLTGTAELQPLPKSQRAIKQEPVPIKKEPLNEVPSKPVEEPQSKPLGEPAMKTLVEPAVKPSVPIKKEPLDVPIKTKPGIKLEAHDDGSEDLLPGLAAPVGSEEGSEAQGPEEFADGSDAQGPKEFADGSDAQGPKEFADGSDAQCPDEPAEGSDAQGPDKFSDGSDAQGPETGNGEHSAAKPPTDPTVDDLPRPALLSTAGIVAPGDQNQARKKSGMSKDKKESSQTRQTHNKKPGPKDEKEMETVAEPKRKPGRPRKHDIQPKAKAKAKVSKKAATPMKASSKRKADEVENSQDTKFYSPEPKSKAKAKAKAKAKSKAKAAPNHPKTRAGSKGGKGKAATSQDQGLKSRKSCAYHKVKTAALKSGLSKEEAITQAKKADPAAVAQHFDVEAIDCQYRGTGSDKGRWKEADGVERFAGTASLKDVNCHGDLREEYNFMGRKQGTAGPFLGAPAVASSSGQFAPGNACAKLGDLKQSHTTRPPESKEVESIEGEMKCSPKVLEMGKTAEGREQLRKLLLDHGSFEKIEGVLEKWHIQKKNSAETGGLVTKAEWKLFTSEIHGAEEADIPLDWTWTTSKESGQKTKFASSFSMDDPDCALLDGSNEDLGKYEASKAPDKTSDAVATAQDKTQGKAGTKASELCTNLDNCLKDLNNCYQKLVDVQANAATTGDEKELTRLKKEALQIYIMCTKADLALNNYVVRMAVVYKIANCLSRSLNAYYVDGRLREIAEKSGIGPRKLDRCLKRSKVPVNFSFLNLSGNAVTELEVENEVNYQFLLLFLAVFGNNLPTSKETQAALVALAKPHKIVSQKMSVRDLEAWALTEGNLPGHDKMANLKQASPKESEKEKEDSDADDDVIYVEMHQQPVFVPDSSGE
ncbi:unnamed protein product, partial [Symbiodinium sp. KB8]